MDENTQAKIVEAGVDVESALNRFMGRDDLLLRFLKKFGEDPNYELFKESMAEKKYEDAFKAAHSLKGVCGNLSLMSLFQTISKEVEFLRNQQYEEAEKMLPQVVEEYDKCAGILKTL